MKLHENKTLFRQAIQFTADQMRIPAIYVEKDYWVTYALYAIFGSDLGKDTVFKGGTALSKCFRLIDRFSEDIDLVVIRREGESDSKLSSKIRAISKIIQPVLPEVEIPGLTQKRGMNRKTAHTYSKDFQGDFGQVRDVVVLESTWLGYYEPFAQKQILSYVGEMMLNNGQEDIAKQYDLLPFEIKVLEPIRTICEKIMSLVRFSYGEDAIEDLKKKIRHTYDLHQLLQQKEYADFLDSPDFDNMLLKVAMDDVVSFRNNKDWLGNHPNEALFFARLEEVWKELSVVYTGSFQMLVFGDLPGAERILETMRRIKDRLKTVEWTVVVEAKDERNE